MTRGALQKLSVPELTPSLTINLTVNLVSRDAMPYRALPCRTVQKLNAQERYMFANVIRDGYVAHMTITRLPAAYEVRMGDVEG